MSILLEHHDRAMELADEADALKKRGETARASELYRSAFEVELTAANAVAERTNYEPTRSILHRSAASLAIQIREFRQAELLICRALTGNPPPDIARELRELWEQTSFEMHLDQQALRLDEPRLLLSMWGEGVGFGYAPFDEVLPRLRDTQSLVYRTAERIGRLPYRETRTVPREIRESFQMFAAAPQAASFAFSLRVGRREREESLFAGLETERVLGEIIECVDLLSQSKYDEVEKRIPEKAYYRNFVALTRQIAPRGKGVSHVGLAAYQNGEVRRVDIIRPKPRSITARNPLFDLSESEGPRRVSLQGTLLFADARRRQQNVIAIKDSTGKVTEIVVPKGLMSDVVRPYFERQVTVDAVLKARFLMLDSISELEDR